MTDATNPFHSVDAPSPAAADGSDAVVRETELLEQLEADLAAVETAIATIERIATDGIGGEQAAVEIGAAVSVERFGAALEPDPVASDPPAPTEVSPSAGPTEGGTPPGPAFG